MSVDYTSNTYLAVSLTPSSIYLPSNPNFRPITEAVASSLPTIPVVHAGNVGQLPDVQLLGVPKINWEESGEDILQVLRGDKGNIARVDVQEQRQRRKRGDEF